MAVRVSSIEILCPRKHRAIFCYGRWFVASMGRLPRRPTLAQLTEVGCRR